MGKSIYGLNARGALIVTKGKPYSINNVSRKTAHYRTVESPNRSAAVGTCPGVASAIVRSMR